MLSDCKTGKEFVLIIVCGRVAFLRVLFCDQHQERSSVQEEAHMCLIMRA